MRNRTIIFVHILKSGGTSLSHSVRIANNYTKDEYLIWPYDIRNTDPEYFSQWPLEKREKLKYIAGHVHFGIHKFIQNPTTYITMIRHPLERILSAISQATQTKQATGNSPWRYFQAGIKRIKLNEIGNKNIDTISFYLCNHATKMLSGAYQDNPIPYIKMTREHLERAKENIENHFSFVCCTEDLDNNWEKIAKKFDWHWHQDQEIRERHRHINHGIEQKILANEISLSLRDQILEENQLDIELYDYIKQHSDRIYNKELC